MPLANVHAPRGFSLYRVAGKKEAVRRERPVIANHGGTNLMAGDAYALDGSGNAFRALGSEAETASVVRGIVEGFRFQAIQASPQGPVSQEYLPDGEAGYVIGIEDDEAEFIVLCSNATAANVGNDADLTNVDGDDTLLAQSRQFVDGGSFLTAGAGQFIMTGIQDSPADNTAGADCRIIVKILNKVI